jgi:hypothetical protein
MLFFLFYFFISINVYIYDLTLLSLLIFLFFLKKLHSTSKIEMEQEANNIENDLNNLTNEDQQNSEQIGKK